MLISNRLLLKNDFFKGLVALAIFFFLPNHYGFFLSANMRAGSSGTVMNWFLWKLVKNEHPFG